MNKKNFKNLIDKLKLINKKNKIRINWNQKGNPKRENPVNFTGFLYLTINMIPELKEKYYNINYNNKYNEKNFEEAIIKYLGFVDKKIFSKWIYNNPEIVGKRYKYCNPFIDPRFFEVETLKFSSEIITNTLEEIYLNLN